MVRQTDSGSDPLPLLVLAAVTLTALGAGIVFWRRRRALVRGESRRGTAR